MASLLKTSREVLEYARELGLDPSRIRRDGFTIEVAGRTPTGRPRFRVTYRTEASRVVELTTTVAPPWRV